MNLEEIIEFEEENTNLDFKRDEYVKGNYDSLIKDIMSMANAINPEVKRIIIGVKHKPGESNKIVGIEKITDQATLENIIQENIEPNINFTYTAFTHLEVKLGVIEILNNCNYPYMMKKDYKDSLKKGDMWIRKGSRQSRVTREDLDRMYEYRNVNKFDKKVKIGFGKKLEKTISFPKIFYYPRQSPSELRKKELEELLIELENSVNEGSGDSNSEKYLGGKTYTSTWGSNKSEMTEKRINVGNGHFGIPSYKNKEEIIHIIKELPDSYSQADLYYLFEESSYKFNCQIYNSGTEFLEGVRIQIYFTKESFVVSNSIIEKPQSFYVNLNLPVSPQCSYPNLYDEDDFYVAEQYHEVIRHKTMTDVFLENLRILVLPNVNTSDIEIKYVISAKNLPNHIEGTLSLNIIES